MHIHNETIASLLKTYLPSHYATEAVRRLNEKGIIVSSDIVRNARNGRPSAQSTSIVSVLIEMAMEQKNAKDELDKLIAKH